MVRIPKELTRSAFGLLGSKLGKEISMTKPKTHFEQVPLEIVQKIVEVAAPGKIRTKPERVSKEKELKKEEFVVREEATKTSRTTSQVE